MKTLVLAASAAALVAGSATAEVLLVVDLSVTDEVTVTATSGLASASATGSPGIGIYMEGLVSGGAASSGVVLSSGDFTTAANATDNSPSLFSFSADTGLNIWSYTADATTDVTSGATAFSGSATWAVSNAFYLELLAGPTSGTVYLPADSDDDLPSGGGSAVAIGEYSVIPEPGSLALLGLGGLAMLRRRR